MDLPNIGVYNLRGLSRRNVLLGKNGCGKSRLLKVAEQSLKERGDIGVIRYISPERAGSLEYEPNIEQTMIANSDWLANTRRRNQAGQFRQQSMTQFRRLELLALREIEKNPALRQNHAHTFDSVVDRINTLLDRVYLHREGSNFVIRDRTTNVNVSPQEISSGESELISLGIECLVFAHECIKDRLNILLLDEPDVHLHPDLQARFGRFLNDLTREAPITLLLATHSTAFLGAMGDDNETCLAFMRFRETNLDFSPISDTHKRVLPVFGAHPLSNVFNEAPVLLLEGEDDERIWQQAVRSANGLVRLYPVAVDGIPHLAPFEREVARILEAVYDDAIGYSLRDRDETPDEIGPVGPVKRFRLNCRSAENLLLTDDVLVRANTNWQELQARISGWMEGNAAHPHHRAMSAFAAGGFDRRNTDLKEVRNDLVGLMGSNKPWEILVGQAIANTVRREGRTGPDSIENYLGPEVCSTLLQITDVQPSG